MAAFQQVPPVDVQLGGQVLGGHTLRDAAQDLQNDTTRVAALAEQSAGEEIEHRAAGAATVIHHDAAMAVMGRLFGRQGMPLGAL
jgi:hypothetical protein